MRAARIASIVTLLGALAFGAADAGPPATAPTIFAAAATADRLPPDRPIPPLELETFVDGVVSQAMTDDHIAGVTVSIVQDGQVVMKKGYGFAALRPWRPVDPDKTLFRLGSMSEVFTWILVLKEVERGHMRLDAPVNLY
ncbi:MAG: serine hydrolase domain-containing protein, partial [Caulobacteraceae bacterium]